MFDDRTPVKQLVILSGKGGTGKTSISAGLIHLSSHSTNGVYVDADVDAANLALVIGAETMEASKFGGSKLAIIDPDLCTGCGNCYDICRFNAIRPPEDGQTAYQVIDYLCDGCSACDYACPEKAIHMETQQDGEWFHSISAYGHLFHAELFPAAENTGKLVTTIKQQAKLFAEDHQIPLMIVDGPPGIGCPVISASTGANLALLVAEPGVSGINDLERIILTLAHFEIPALICINKSNIYPQGTKDIIDLAHTYGHQIAGEIPFDKAIPESMVLTQPITQYDPSNPASIAIEQIWQSIHQILMKNKSED